MRAAQAPFIEMVLPTVLYLGKYENHNGLESHTVWVKNEQADMDALTILVRELMGDETVPEYKAQKTPKWVNEAIHAIHEAENRKG